ncbi:hypothetical protein MNBD_GAMMA01-246 [hydrothermal vent metagenome]|uniref:Uncharacterized protein n=1 Tax=hydrothermal vent metagenome TaxID=652676 RepID=A0A3B0VB28_9ZZZZ
MFIFHYKKINVIRGAIVYSVFDAAAALYLQQFSWLRFFGIMLVGATIYTFEIPNYFAWIEKQCARYNGYQQQIKKTIYALVYFNPLWIARHLLIIDLLTIGSSSFSILKIALISFVVNIPISLFVNFFIQNQIKLSSRYIASAVFSGVMAVYYAFSRVLFGDIATNETYIKLTTVGM